MNHLVRRLVLAAATLAVLAPAALAGGASAKVEGPFKDGRYLVRTYTCSDPANLDVTAWAEGLVDGKRLTVPIKLEMTRTKGRRFANPYWFKRTWSEGGQWAIRMALGSQGHTPVTVTALDRRGAVKANKLIWEGDGKKECVAILNGRGC